MTFLQRKQKLIDRLEETFDEDILDRIEEIFNEQDGVKTERKNRLGIRTDAERADLYGRGNGSIL